MNSNVINLLDIRRTRAADAECPVRPQLIVQLDLPFDGVVTCQSQPASPFSDCAAPLGQTASEVVSLPAATVGSVLLAHPKYLFLAFAEDFSFHDDFLNFCKAMKPDLVIDLRVAPRLDFVRPVRKQAFELFDMCGIEYRDLLGRLSVGSYDLSQGRFEEVLNAVESLHNGHDEGRPTLGLFDNATFAQFCMSKLSQTMSVMTLDADAIRRMVAEGARVRM